MSAASGAAVSQLSPRSFRLARAAMGLSTAALATLALWNLWRLSPIVSDVPFQHRMEGRWSARGWSSSSFAIPTQIP